MDRGHIRVILGLIFWEAGVDVEVRERILVDGIDIFIIVSV